MLNTAQMKSPVHLGGQRGFDSVNHKGSKPMNMVAQFNPDESLVPVLEGDIGGIVQPVVNARELHKWLKNGDRFATWIKGRIKKYEFLENEDFACFSEISEKPQGGRPNVQYILTLDMAKELSMVENNEQGKIARRYFIRCERELHQANNNLMIQLLSFVECFKSANEESEALFASISDKTEGRAKRLATLGMAHASRFADYQLEESDVIETLYKALAETTGAHDV